MPRGGLPLLAALAIGWGSFWPFMKIALTEMPILTFRAICGEVGGIALLLIALIAGQSLAVPRGDWLRLLLLSIFGTTGWLCFSALGVSILGSGRAVLIAYTMPLWAFLLGIWFLNERPSAKRWFGLALGLGGIGIMVGQDLDFTALPPTGVLAMLGAALSWALGSVVFKYKPWGTRQLALVGWQTVIGGLPICVAALLIDRGGWLPLSGIATFALTYNVVIGVVFGVWAWFRVVEQLPISVASLGVLMVPVIGLVSSAVIVGERFGWPEYLALGLIIVGLTTVLPLPRLPWQRR